MKLSSIAISCLLFCTTVATTAQNRLNLSNTTVTKTFNFTDYTQLEVSGDFKVNLNFSNTSESITVEANSNLMDKVKVSKDGNTLHLKLESIWNIGGKMILNVNINSQRMIDHYQLSGDAVLTVNDPITANAVTLMLKGDSIMQAEVDAKSLKLMAKSDSIVKLSGTVENVDATLGSDSILKAENLIIAHTNINLSSDSQATINATTTLSAVASGDSILRYKGNPDVKKSIMTGDSEIHRMR